MENDETSPLRKTPKLQYDSSKRLSPNPSSSSAASANAANSLAGAIIPIAAVTAAAASSSSSKHSVESARYTPRSSAGGNVNASTTSDRSAGSAVISANNGGVGGSRFASDVRPTTVGEKMVWQQQQVRNKQSIAGAAAAVKGRTARSPSKSQSPSSRGSPSTSSSGMSPCPLEVCKQRAGLTPSAAGRQAASTTTAGSSTPTDGADGAGPGGGKAAVTTRQPMPKITFEKRSDDECMGGVVRWAEKCERHVVRRQPWNCTRWTESKLQHPNMIGRPVWEPDPNAFIGTTREQKQQPLYAPSKANCDLCDKRFCGGGLNPNFQPRGHDSPCDCCCRGSGGGGGGSGCGGGSPYDGGWNQQQSKPPTIPDNIPFMRAPVCPEDHLFDTPTRCQARFGMGPPPSSGQSQQLPMKGPPGGGGGYQRMNEHMVTNVMKFPLTSKPTADSSSGSSSRNYPALPPPPVDSRYNNIISHISGFDSQLTVPLNTNYVGYSQKYPQDIIKSTETKTAPDA